VLLAARVDSCRPHAFPAAIVICVAVCGIIAHYTLMMKSLLSCLVLRLTLLLPRWIFPRFIPFVFVSPVLHAPLGILDLFSICIANATHHVTFYPLPPLLPPPSFTTCAIYPTCPPSRSACHLTRSLPCRSTAPTTPAKPITKPRAAQPAHLRYCKYTPARNKARRYSAALRSASHIIQKIGHFFHFFTRARRSPCLSRGPVPTKETSVTQLSQPAPQLLLRRQRLLLLVRLVREVMHVRHAATTRQLSCSSAFPARGRVAPHPRQRAHGAWLYCYIFTAAEVRAGLVPCMRRGALPPLAGAGAASASSLESYLGQV
jgi:hypothetical protein